MFKHFTRVSDQTCLCSDTMSYHVCISSTVKVLHALTYARTDVHRTLRQRCTHRHLQISLWFHCWVLLMMLQLDQYYQLVWDPVTIINVCCVVCVCVFVLTFLTRGLHVPCKTMDRQTGLPLCSYSSEGYHPLV